MKRMRWIPIAVLLIALTMAVAACGGADPTSPPPTNTPVPPPTNTPVPPPPTDTPVPPTTEAPSEPSDDDGATEPGDGDGASEPSDDDGDTEPAGSADASLDLDGLSGVEELDSFRSEMTISWQGTNVTGTEVSESMMINVEFVREPEAQHVTIGGDFPGTEELGLAEGEFMEMYVVEGTMYMNLFGSWIQVPADEGGLDADEMAFAATEEMLDGLENANYEGTTTYNGVEVEHWTFNETSFPTDDMADMQVEEATGNIYLATDGGYVVHMDAILTGTNVDLPTGDGSAPLQDGTMEIVVDLLDINQPIDIQVPPEALEGSEPPDDIPVPEDAEEFQFVDFMGMMTFLSPAEPAEVADFYRTGMPANGWTEVSAEDMSGMHLLEYSKDGRLANLMIVTDTDTGKTSVLITIENPE